jgi:hypothetical protein
MQVNSGASYWFVYVIYILFSQENPESPTMKEVSLPR